MKVKVIKILVVIILILCGAFIGRLTVPVKEIVVEKEVEKILEVESKSSGLAKEYLFKFIDIRENIEALPWHEDEYLTTPGMRNLASQEYKMWDDFLNEIYNKLKEVLSFEDMEKLKEAQINWIDDRDVKAENDGKKYEGGTMQPLMITMTKSGITKQRCLELIDIYMN